MNGLNPRQLAVLEFIAEHRLRTGVTPTMQAIADGLGLSHRELVHQTIVRLQAKGMLNPDKTLTEMGRKQLSSKCPHCGNKIYVED